MSRFPLYAPELAYSNSGFVAGAHEQLAQDEAQSFWFRARNAELL